MQFKKSEYVKINGIEQFLYHSGTDYNNPVILFLHGGPGVVESNYAGFIQGEWEKDYTVVHFDQRGSGKTFIKNPKSYPTVELLISDIREIILYIKKVYNKEKIIILGYSFGSVLGSIYIKEYAQDVLFYIGVGQLVNMQTNERVLYKKLKNEFEKLGKKRLLKKLKSLGKYPEKFYTESMERKYIAMENLLRRSTIKSDKSWDLIVNFVRSPIFKISDLRARFFSNGSNKKLMEFLINFNLYNYGMQYDVPIVYILGECDWQVSTILAKKFFKDIQTDKKRLYIVKNAKHRPMIENKKEFDKIIASLKGDVF